MKNKKKQINSHKNESFTNSNNIPNLGATESGENTYNAFDNLQLQYESLHYWTEVKKSYQAYCIHTTTTPVQQEGFILDDTLAKKEKNPVLDNKYRNIHSLRLTYLYNFMVHLVLLYWKLKWLKPGGVLMYFYFFTYIVCIHIFLSKRFHRIIDLLWVNNTRIVRFYVQLYIYFVVATKGILFLNTPLALRLSKYYFSGNSPQQKIYAINNESLMEGAEINCNKVMDIKTSEKYTLLVRILSYINYTVFIAVAYIVIVLFWKTHYRIPTIKDRRRIQTDSILTK